MDRRVDETDQVIRCAHCLFVAPISLSYEEYQYLHRVYNNLLCQDCFASNPFMSTTELDPTTKLDEVS
ncbi:ac56-like protein [Cryptophlebia peltastica nucleopolyhedrovirus]|uniref:Ac56-like protein n=1 Tax=Cryptophlebia peltastica nucleopolyhedrovirus TaxID=2304025 RepID=A0A346RNR1_9ABAC|nr:ac56-like protein [Cryptophlebia peltastica nucleopolyhedrovirus]AXS67708.1 ac56-like protein [Cryptophlebia peltastica nucleopolyhedrovirus]